MSESADAHPSHLRLYSLILLMTLLWSGNYIVAKWALQQFPPLLASGARTGLAGCFMIPVYIWHTRRSGGVQWTRKQVPALVSLGLLGVGLNQLFFILGIGRTSVAHAAIVVSLTPMLVLLMAAAARQEKITTGKVVGMIVAITGVIVLQVSGSQANSASLAGDFFIFLACATFAIFTVRGKTQAATLGGITLNTFAYVGSGLALLPLTLWYGARFSFEAVTWSGWACLFYMAMFPSVLCYLIYYYALTHIPASRVAAFSYIQPLMAMIMAVPLLGEQPTRALLTGGVLVLAGVFLAERM